MRATVWQHLSRGVALSDYCNSRAKRHSDYVPKNMARIFLRFGAFSEKSMRHFKKNLAQVFRDFGVTFFSFPAPKIAV